jgi:hypothetical protein
MLLTHQSNKVNKPTGINEKKSANSFSAKQNSGTRDEAQRKKCMFFSSYYFILRIALQVGIYFLPCVSKNIITHEQKYDVLKI